MHTTLGLTRVCPVFAPRADAIRMTEFGTIIGGIFGGRADFEGKSRAYIDDTIRSGQLRLAVLIWVMFILTVLSIFIELVAGYCLGGGAAGVTWSALPHGVWQVPNLMTLFFAIQSIYLGVDTDVGATLTGLVVAMWFILIACLLNIVQLVAVCFEVDNSNSTFWLQNGGAWVWVLLIGLIVFILWDLLIAWHLFVFRANLANAHYNYAWMPSGTVAPPAADQGDNNSAAQVLTQARVGSKLFTPAGTLHGGRTKDQ